MIKCNIEWRRQSRIGNRYQITFNQPIRVCYKSKTFILLRLKNSGKYSVRNLCYDYFFIKEENGKVFETLKSLKYKTSPISSGGLEVPLSLTFSCKEKWVVDTMEEFVQNFYTFEYRRNQSVNTNDSKDEEEDDY